MDFFWMKSCEMKLHSTAKKPSLTLVLYLCVLELCYCYVNVALNKPTYQQFPYKPGDDTYDSSNAVDGLKADLTWNGGQCVYSNPKKTATWWVNLTSIHSIHHITIYFMTDTITWGPYNKYTSSFLGFSLHVSNTTDISQGILCFEDKKFTTRTIPAVFTTNCSIPGQYVIYYNERLTNDSYPKEYSPFVQSNLCEVEVYECSPGNYGINCLQKCGKCRGKSPCNKFNGSCPDGCSAGYIGSLCSEHCKETFYGINCTQKCSKNCNNQTCHHVTGNCTRGQKSCVPHIIGGCIAVVVLVLAVILIFLFCKRRKGKTKEPREDSDEKDETDGRVQHRNREKTVNRNMTRRRI